MLWWETRVQVIEDWVQSNPLGLGIPSDGCLNVRRRRKKKVVPASK